MVKFFGLAAFTVIAFCIVEGSSASADCEITQNIGSDLGRLDVPANLINNANDALTSAYKKIINNVTYEAILGGDGSAAIYIIRPNGEFVAATGNLRSPGLSAMLQFSTGGIGGVGSNITVDFVQCVQ